MNKKVFIALFITGLFLLSGLTFLNVNNVNQIQNHNVNQPVIQSSIKKLPMNSQTNVVKTTITINNAPSGKGYYQQLLTLPITININVKIGNFYFTSDNGSELYAWVQSYNSSSFSVWVKIPNGTQYISMYSGYSNGFYSSNGFLGEAPIFGQSRTNDNGKYVFEYYDNFLNGSGLNVNSGTSAIFNDGLALNGSLRTNVTFPYGVLGLYGNYTNEVPSGVYPYSYTSFQNTTNLQDVIFGWFGGNGYDFFDSNITNSHNNIGISTSYQGKFTLYSLYMNSSDPTNFYLTYGNYKYSLSNQPQFYSASNYITIDSPPYGTSYFDYLFIRAPLSAMPTYSISSTLPFNSNTVPDSNSIRLCDGLYYFQNTVNGSYEVLNMTTGKYIYNLNKPLGNNLSNLPVCVDEIE